MELVWGLGLIVVVALLAQRTRRRQADRLCRRFESTEFHTPAGRLHGRDLRVVRFILQEIGGDHGRGLRTGWWYCVAPGRRWLLVVAQDEPSASRHCELKWLVRELSEERMRGALSNDSRALDLAFDRAIEG